MGKSGKQMAKGHPKDDRKARKAESNRARDKGKQRQQHIDPGQLVSFGKMLQHDGYELMEVERDGNCFFRALADQLESNEHNHTSFRKLICEHLAAHEDDFSPFMSFGESEEEEDKDYTSYVERMGTDAEWAGQVEVIAAAQALRVNIVVHQHEHPSYRIECDAGGNAERKGKSPRVIHVSYHDGEHYNSVRSQLEPPPAGRSVFTRGISHVDDEDSANEPSLDSLSADLSQASLVAIQDADGNANDGPSKCARAVEANSANDAIAPAAPATGIEKARDAKARKKEEKRLRKESKHREALATSRLEDDGSGKADGGRANTPATERNIITL